MAEHDFQKVLDVAPVGEGGSGEHEFSATPIGDGGPLYGGQSLGLAFHAATKTVNPAHCLKSIPPGRLIHCLN